MFSFIHKQQFTDLDETNQIYLPLKFNDHMLSNVNPILNPLKIFKKNKKKKDHNTPYQLMANDLDWELILDFARKRGLKFETLQDTIDWYRSLNNNLHITKISHHNVIKSSSIHQIQSNEKESIYLKKLYDKESDVVQSIEVKVIQHKKNKESKLILPKIFQSQQSLKQDMAKSDQLETIEKSNEKETGEQFIDYNSLQVPSAFRIIAKPITNKKLLKSVLNPTQSKQIETQTIIPTLPDMTKTHEHSNSITKIQIKNINNHVFFKKKNSIVWSSPKHAQDQSKPKSSSQQRDLNQDVFQTTSLYFQNANFPNDKLFKDKYAQMREWNNILNMSNNIFIEVPKNVIYKAYIGKGNNSQLVKTVIKSRWWWSIVDSDENDVQLIWTSLKKNNIIESLKKSSKTSNSVQQLQSISTFENEIYFPSQRKEISFVEDYYVYQKLINCNLLNTISKHFLKNKSNRTGHRILSYQQFKNIGLISISMQSPFDNKMHNHLQNNYHLSNKKALFYNLKNYFNQKNMDVFDYHPVTFHIQGADDHTEINKFIEFYKKRQEHIQQIDQEIEKNEKNEKNESNGQKQNIKKMRNIWIVKPGEITNRGQGIKVCSEIKEIIDILNLKEVHKNNTLKSYIVQLYIDRPLLYQKRKFDIRCYIMFTSINGCHKGYWYADGYVRTSSKEFQFKNLQNKMIHLTNDAIQKKSDDYGKFEKGNKISYEELSKYLATLDPPTSFQDQIYPQLKNLAFHCFQGIGQKIDPCYRKNSFEIFGLDFMIDDNYKVWLIEANTNPCIELSCPLLSKIIPAMLDNAFRIVLDPLFPPPLFYQQKKLIPGKLDQNKFELIFEHQMEIEKENEQNDIQIGFEEFQVESEEDE